MKKIIYLILLINLHFASKAQTTFWTEDFGTNPVCGVLTAAAYTGTNGAWTTSLTGTNQAFANAWYVSPVEAGMGVGNCGDGCSSNPILINRTLHISTNASLLGDIGAAYSAGAGSNTDVRAQSPTINCTGKSGIVLKYNYIMWGIVNQDYMQAYYSVDNGVTWSSLGTPPQTPTVSCSGQGIWTSYSVALPAAANNTATVKVGFRWQNTSASGADPSVAVDDVVLTYTASVASITPTFALTSPLCKGDSTQVTANTGTVAATGYTWSSNPVSPVIAAPNASVTYIKFNSAGTFTITLAAASGTTTGSTSHTILVNPTPTIGATAVNQTMCVGGSATLTASGGVTYTWTPGNLSGSPVVVSPTITTNYLCTGSNSFACKSSTSINVTINPSPTIGITSTTLNLCSGTGQSATLSASGAVTYTWLPSNSNATSLVVSPTVNTTYTCSGTSTLGCRNSNTLSITVTTCSGGSAGLNSYALNTDLFNIYPNPLNDKMTLNAGGENLNNVKVEFVDMLGKKVIVLDFNLITANSSQIINTSTLPKGVYFVNVKVSGKDQKPIRIIKE